MSIYRKLPLRLTRIKTFDEMKGKTVRRSKQLCMNDIVIEFEDDTFILIEDKSGWLSTEESIFNDHAIELGLVDQAAVDDYKRKLDESKRHEALSEFKRLGQLLGIDTGDLQ